jgi:hypothetical protein
VAICACGELKFGIVLARVIDDARRRLKIGDFWRLISCEKNGNETCAVSTHVFVLTIGFLLDDDDVSTVESVVALSCMVLPLLLLKLNVTLLAPLVLRSLPTPLLS